MKEKKVKLGAVQNKDSELRYTVRAKGSREGAPKPEDAAGGPDIAKHLKSEPRSSVTG